jgi:taurine dioxygenase
MAIEVIKTGAALGAEIRGVDLTRELDDATFAAVRNAFYENEVVFFRGRRLSDEDHIRFSARFGELRKIKLTESLHVQHPELFVVSNIRENGKPIGSVDAGLFWHTDGAYLANPHAVSLLHALLVPEQDGRTLGDTRYASMTASYDALSAGMKKRIDGLKAVQSIAHREGKTREAGGNKKYNADVMKDPEAVHPVVRTHPITKRKCLYVSEGYTASIVGMPEDEGADLIAELAAHCVRPQFVYRHNWQPDDLVMWDDCSTQHKATFDYPPELPRRMHRTTVINGL